MKLSASRSNYNFYESFSDLLFCTLVLFIVLVLALALNVNKKVKDYKTQLRQEANPAALAAAQAEAAQLRQRLQEAKNHLQTMEKRLQEAEAGTPALARAQADLRAETERANKAEIARSKALGWLQVEKEARAKAEKRAEEAERQAAEAKKRAADAERRLAAQKTPKELANRLAAAEAAREEAEASLKEAEKRLSELRKRGLTNKEFSPGVFFYTVKRNERVVVGGEPFTPKQLVAMLKSMEGDVIISFVPNDDYSQCPPEFKRQYLPFLTGVDVGDMDVESLRRQNQKKW